MSSDAGAWVRYHRAGGAADRRIELDPERPLSFGRRPGAEGLVLDPDDLSVSSIAGVLRAEGSAWVLENRSRFATLQLVRLGGVRFLPPGGSEEVVHDGDTIVVPSRSFEHRLEAHLPRADAQAALDEASGTIRVDNATLSLNPGDREAVVALVAGWFVPERYDPTPLSPADIARLLSTPERPVTRKAVNNRLERARAAMSAVEGRAVESSAELAALVLKRGLVTRDAVLRLIERG
jgi:hypothetical protein